MDVARLTREQKQPHVLITAFSLLAKEFPDWDLEFWGVDPGDGSYQKYLSDLVGKLGLNDRVFFRGVTTDVLSVYLNSDIFAIPSSFEGFGLAMTEAMSAGLPAVGFKSCDAVNEIIRDEVSGFLTDDGPEAYAEALRKLMADPMLRKKMGHAAKLEMEEFSPERVWDEWEKLLSKLVQNKKQ
ncbi:glycosyltransferase [Dialister hominis]|uniref:glycosyltransferase n=1 Tax=Dialister hominis TaxID=2582419 RepID=UPI003FEFD3FB